MWIRESKGNWGSRKATGPVDDTWYRSETGLFYWSGDLNSPTPLSFTGTSRVRGGPKNAVGEGKTDGVSDPPWEGLW